MKRDKKLRKNYIWNTIGILFNSIYSIILIFFITRFTTNGIEIAGKFSYAFYICSLFATIGNFGGRILQISNVDENYDDVDFISLKFISNILMFLSLGLFLILNKYNFEKIVLFLILIVYRAFESISDSYYGVMQKNNDLYYVGKSMIVKSLGSSLLFVVLYCITNNLIISSCSFIFVFFMMYLFYDRRICNKNYKVSKPKLGLKLLGLLKKSTFIFLFSFLVLVTANVARYFVDLRLTDYDQGLFGIIILPASLLTLIGQFIIQPLLTRFVNYYNSGEIKTYYKDANKILLFLFGVGILIGLFMYLIGINMLGFIYGVELSSYKFISFILVLSGMCNACVSILSNLLTILKKEKIQLFLFSLSIVIVVIYSYFRVDSLNSALASYCCVLCIEFFLFYLYFIIVCKKGINNEKHMGKLE